MAVDTLRVAARLSNWSNNIDLMVIDGDAVGRAIELQVVPVGAQVDPTMSLSRTAAQALMDDLWTAGLRPTAEHNDAGAFAAQKRHLEDMRAIAFNQMGLDALVGSK